MKTHTISTASHTALAAALSGVIASMAVAQGNATTSFSDLPNAVFVELPLGNPTGPFGPFEFDFSGGGAVAATLVADAMSCPDNIGTHGEQLTIPNDPLVDPGDHNGRFVENTAACPNQTITLDFSEPVTAAGVSFRHASCGFTAQGDRTIFVFDGPAGTGNMIGTASTVGFAYPCFNTWLDFVGVVSSEANIRSMVIESDNDLTLMVGLAASPGSLTKTCLADLEGDGSVGVPDLLLLLGSWGPCESCAADLDSNGAVGVPDLLLLLGAWGSC